ncbi:MAG TPA: sulfite exporter TauE/SafE family protein [Vicinamibacterales bacterium]|nr:sulfite exporter TauE/SafE family protein [Vicinamibacterales bacterium]
MSLLGYSALFAVGFVAAVINVIAAGGSFLTLPLLIFLGLPPGIANATNRVGVLAQNVSAVVGFHRHNVLPLRWSLAVSVPALAGAAIGVWAALHVPDVLFQRVLSVVMLAMTLVTFLSRRGQPDTVGEPHSASHPLVVLGFFLVGLYGGFIQAGVGFIALAVTTLAGLDLVRGNAVKVFAVMLLTLLSVVVFAVTGRVDWPAGVALGLGNLLGGFVRVKLAVMKGQQWLEAVVTVTVVVFAVLLWVSG